MGNYKDAQYLPSYEKMSEITGSSVSTVRRTIRLLSQLGVVQPVNGKGIRIFSANTLACASDLTEPAIRRHIVCFFQVFEIVTCSCKNIIVLTLHNLTADAKNELIKDLENYSLAQQYDFAFWRYLICIAGHCPLAAVREVYGKIYSLFLFGIH